MPKGVKNPDATAEDNANKLVLSLNANGENYGPFRDAWKLYSEQPVNKEMSNSGLLFNIVCEAIGFDPKSIVRKQRGKGDTLNKQFNAIVKKAKAMTDKKSAIDSMALWVLKEEGPEGLKDMFGPEEIARYVAMSKENRTS